VLNKMKRSVSMASVGLASAALLAGGGWFGAQPITDAATTQVTLTYPASALSSLDPISWSGEILVDQGTLFDGLFGYNQKNQVVPVLAQKWTSTDGGRVWTFWIRHGAKWSNGAPVTAQDFYYSWMRLVAPSDSTGAIWASVMQYVKNSYTYHAGGVPASAVGVKVINNYEIQLTLGGPHNILGDLPLAGSMPLYPPDVEAHPTDWWMPQYFVGDGPYVIKKFVINGDDTMVRNPHYVNMPGQPKPGNVQQINLIPAPTVPVEDFESGALSAGLITSASDYKYALTHFKGELHAQAQANLGTLQWDRSAVPSPLFNLKVRQAIAMAVNRAPIANPVLNGMVGATSVFGYKGWPTAALEHGLPYNIKAARKLLAQAGYPNGKGMPQLYLYAEAPAGSTSVLTAEAVAQELKSALNLNFKIEPMNATQWGDITWGGLNQGILPGYNIGDGTANWNDVTYQPLQANQQVGDEGTYGSEAFLAYAAKNWYYPAYDPNDVKAWGSPTNTSLGVNYSTWQPIIKAAKADIAYIDAWTAKQPKAYQEYLNPPGSESLSQQMAYYLSQYTAAKTDSAKHAAWETFWKWVGTYSSGNGGASIGLNAQVYSDKHEPHEVYLWTMWQDEAGNTVNASQAYHLYAQVVDGLMQQGYMEPLYYTKAVFLEAKNVTGVMANPWAYGGFYQMQYVSVK